MSREGHLYEKWLGWLDRIDNDLTNSRSRPLRL